MQAWRIAGFGGPEVLEQHTVTVSEPIEDEIVVEVAHCGVCRHDLLTREGAFPNVALPLTLGHQVAGTVVAAGPAARWPVGTPVMSLIFMGCGHCPSCTAGNPAGCLTGRAKFMGDDFDGGYAQYVGTPDRAFTQVPDGIGLDIAAVVNCTVGTAYHAVHARAEVQQGQTVLVTGASGGIGVHTLDVLRHAGARSIAITTRPEQADRLRLLGADEVIADPELAFARTVKAMTDGVGADAVIDVVGSRTLQQSLHAVRTGGRVVVLGNVDGAPSQVRPAHLIMKEIALLGTKSCTANELQQVLSLVAAGELSVDIAEHRPLGDVRAVHEQMHAQQNSGRVVLDVKESFS